MTASSPPQAVRFPPTAIIDADSREAYTLCGVGLAGTAEPKVAAKVRGHIPSRTALVQAYARAERAWTRQMRGRQS